MTKNIFEICLDSGFTSDANALASCLAVHTNVQDHVDNITKSRAWITTDEGSTSPVVSTVPFLLFASSLVFFMQAGFSMICAGSVRRKNVQNTVLKNLLDLCGSAISFFIVGYAFAYGSNDINNGITFIGGSNFFLVDMTDDETGLELCYWFFQCAFAATSATIVAGTLAERCQMNAYLLFSMILIGFVYPVIVHAIWSNNGFLSPMIEHPLFGSGMVDFAGSGVVHVTGGFCALLATRILGARKGRFHNRRGELLEEPKTFPGHSKALQMIGTFILWFGWYGFNAGSAISSDGSYSPAIVSVSVVNTTLCGSISGVTSLFTNLFITERRTGEPHFNLGFAMNGCLAGLAAIAGSCGIVEPWAALVIGIVSGLFFIAASKMLEYFRLDDAVDAIPVHLAGGSWGVIATGLFASPTGMRRYYNIEYAENVGLFYSFGRGAPDGSLLGCQVIGLFSIIIWVGVNMYPFFTILSYLGLLRADSLEEIVGLDISYHGWIPSQADDVTQRDFDAYFRRHNNSRAQRSHHSVEFDDQQDNEGVDRFQ